MEPGNGARLVQQEDLEVEGLEPALQVAEAMALVSAVMGEDSIRMEAPLWVVLVLLALRVDSGL